MLPPKISVITVSFNHAHFIRQNIESVLAQNYPNFEHIIIDGGSTDETISILKEYPHLRWTSEPDRGQSNALNKGFSRATGEIIAWCNSDDWYPLGAFSAVVDALKDSPIVMGASQCTTKEGTPTELVPNISRSLYDLMKYWVYYSSPVQPSVFFRKELLEQVKLHDGSYIDEDCEFCMDAEFWMRICRHVQHIPSITNVLSYNRMYEDTKTGKYPQAVYREMSRVFRRNANLLSEIEREFSIVVPVETPTAELDKLIQSIGKQNYSEYEVLVVAHSNDPKSARAVRNATLELSERYPDLSIRTTTAAGNIYTAWQAGIMKSHARYAVLALAGDQIGAEFSKKLGSIFAHNNVGAVILGPEARDVRSPLYFERNGTYTPSPLGILQLDLEAPRLAIRKVAFQDLGGWSKTEGPASNILAWRQGLTRLLYKGWQCAVGQEIEFHQASTNFFPQGLLTELRSFITSQILVEIEKEKSAEPFAAVRSEHGFSLNIESKHLEVAKRLLAIAPPSWWELGFSSLASDELLSVALQYPNFSPLWWILRSYDESSMSLPRVELVSRYEQATRVVASL